MSQSFEKINQNKKEILENLSKKILLSKDIVNRLYNLFILSENFNNPRNRYVLEREDRPYTIPYLAQRLNLSEKETFNIFNKLPFCSIKLHKDKIPVVYFIDFAKFKKFILRKYKHFSNIEKNIANFHNSNEKKQINEKNKIDNKILDAPKDIDLADKLKNFNQDELLYLKLVVSNNPSGIFNINKSKVNLNKLNKELRKIHYNKYDFFNKCIALGLMERIKGPKLKIKEEILDYFT